MSVFYHDKEVRVWEISRKTEQAEWVRKCFENKSMVWYDDRLKILVKAINPSPERDVKLGLLDTAVITFVERKTRFMVGIKTKSKNAEDVRTTIDTFMSRFEPVCDSLTCDRGTEFTSVMFINQIENTYKKKLYYADAQSPGQRGTNERFKKA